MITGMATTAGSTSVFRWGDKQDSSLGGGDLAVTLRATESQHAERREACHGHLQSFFKEEAGGLQTLSNEE